MKFVITADGGHKAEVTITEDGKGGFTGSLVSPDYGTGEIKAGVKTGQAFAGKVDLAGYEADFSATLDGSNISGRLKYGWFFNKSFTGTQAA